VPFATVNKAENSPNSFTTEHTETTHLPRIPGEFFKGFLSELRVSVVKKVTPKSRDISKTSCSLTRFPSAIVLQ
jgi:hypothetical protein